MTRRRRWLGLLLGAAVAVPAGCGSDDEPEPEPTPAPPTSNQKVRTQWGSPTGPFEGRDPKALVMLVHGGAWRGNDPRQFAAQRIQAANLQRLGYATLNLDYRPGITGINDVDRIYKQARRRVGPDMPICALGGSAGGHISLMLAVRNPDLSCVISVAAPTDLVALRSTPGQKGYKLAVSSLGATRLSELSPARNGRRIRADLLLVYATNDPLVPVSQARRMAKASPGTRTIILPPGETPFAHSKVDAAAKQKANVAQLEFLALASKRR